VVAAARCAARGKLGHLSSLRKDDRVMAVGLESEDALTNDRTDARNRRIEVITGRERRRRWTADQKCDQRAKSLASRMNERTRQLLRVPPRVDEWHTAIREVRSIARSDRRNGVGTADGLDLQISKIN